MANYKDIHGTTVRNSAGDLDGAATGELWFDSTNRDFKYKYPNVTSAGSWRTGNSVNTARLNPAGAGTQTSALIFGGRPPEVAVTESYDGTSWTEVSDLNTARGEGAGAGTSNTAALAFGGFLSPPDTMYALNESWNGSSWTEVGDLNTARLQLAGDGASNTAAIAIAGYDIPAAVAIAET